MMIISRKRYNKIMDNMYDIGYKHGFEAGKVEGIKANFTPNELRVMMGLPTIPKDEVRNNE